MFDLAGGSATYTFDEAIATVRAYMCETEMIDPKRGYASVFDAEEVPRFAYRTYDCVAASPGHELSDTDLFVIAGLNGLGGRGVSDAEVVARLRSFGHRAAEPLRRAADQQDDFRQLTRSELGPSPAEGTAGWWLRVAHRQGMATPVLGVARVHKVLHHKRPNLFPLLDNQALKLIKPAADAAGCGQWQLIHAELHNHHNAFTRLEHETAEIAMNIGGVPLSWLRLHDILIWMQATGQRRH